jgi:hypothetical protein
LKVADIVHDKNFENAILKLQGPSEAVLSPAEKEAVKVLSRRMEMVMEWNRRRFGKHMDRKFFVRRNRSVTSKRRTLSIGQFIM